MARIMKNAVLVLGCIPLPRFASGSKKKHAYLSAHKPAFSRILCFGGPSLRGMYHEIRVLHQLPFCCPQQCRRIILVLFIDDLQGQNKAMV